MKPIAIWLASSSPRRQALLAQWGLRFEVRPPCVQEEDLQGLAPAEMAMSLAARKASACYPPPEGIVVLAADTIVSLEGEILGKPASTSEARRFLKRLSNRWHVVHTGVALAWQDQMHLFYEQTAVRFHALSEAFIDHYLQTSPPLDKAGAYGAQDLIGLFGIAEIQGDYYNVMGLPMQKLGKKWQELFGELF